MALWISLEADNSESSPPTNERLRVWHDQTRESEIPAIRPDVVKDKQHCDHQDRYGLHASTPVSKAPGPVLLRLQKSYIGPHCHSQTGLQYLLARHDSSLLIRKDCFGSKTLHRSGT